MNGKYFKKIKIQWKSATTKNVTQLTSFPPGIKQPVAQSAPLPGPRSYLPPGSQQLAPTNHLWQPEACPPLPLEENQFWKTTVILQYKILTVLSPWSFCHRTFVNGSNKIFFNTKRWHNTQHSTDIANYRLNQPRGQFIQNCFRFIFFIKKIFGLCFIFLALTV